MIRPRLALLALLVVAACSSKTDGPTPKVDTVLPASICNAQQMLTLTIAGSGFSAVVLGGLTDSPSVELPRVVFTDANGTAFEVPADGVSLTDASGMSLTIVVPQGLLPPGTYSVEVTNPNGRSGSSADFVVNAPPDLISVSPAVGAPAEVVDVTLTGTDFQPGMTVTLSSNPPVMCTNVVVSPDGTSATCSLDLTNVMPGAYDLVVDNGDGCTDTLPGAFTVTRDFILAGIEPPFGCTCEDTNVTILSNGRFAATPRVEMRPHGQATPVTVMKRVAFVDASTLTAVVPSGLSLGDYDVTVINPPSAGGIGTLENGFRVVMLPPPVVEEVVPSRGTPQADTVVQIFGKNFRNQVKIEMLDRNGVVVRTVGPQNITSAGLIDTTLPTNGMTQDAYLIRVTNVDENTYGTWSAFIVGATGSSGNLHAFTASTMLTTGRRMLGGVSARDDLGNTFLYAIGGDTGNGGTTLDNVEVSQLSRFGKLGPWRPIPAPNKLTTPRDAPVAFAVPLYGSDPFIPDKTYVYVSGGRNAGGTVLGTVERAMVLRNADAPRITAIAASATAGTLAAGTWYYKVSAVVDSGDLDNPGGETLPSDEEVIPLTATGAVDLTWNAVTVNGTPVVGYRVYRTVAVDGISQQEKLIATVTATSYTDTGSAAGTEGPLPAGSLGIWQLQAPTHGARWGHQGAVIADGSNRYVYLLGGKSDGTAGYLSTVEVSAIDAQGHLGAFVTTGTTVLATARAFSSLVVETTTNVSSYAGIARMFMIGGVDASGESGETVFSDVTSGGGNGAWTVVGVATTSTSGSLGNRAGPMAVIASSKLFCLGGAGMATNTTFSNIRATGVDVAFTNTGAIGSPIQSTAEAFPGGSPRALGVAIIGSGFIYVVGGTSNGTDATNTTFQTF